MSKKKRKKLGNKLAPLHIRYRPQTLGDVIGQRTAVTALENLLSGTTRPHSYLFTGPSGVGKTTLARILAKEFDVERHGIVEIDAATHSGIDNMRSIKEVVSTANFGRNPRRLLILDECHALSAKAWQSWLKIIEEPPSHLYIAFCTTEAGKVPRTIKTRCHAFDLKLVPTKEIVKFLDEIIFAEGEDKARQLSDSSLRAIANKAAGSVRQALVYLSMTMHCETKAQVLETLDEADEGTEEVFRIVQAVVANAPFMRVKKMIADLETVNCEGVRIVIVNYTTKVLLNTKDKKKCGWLLNILDEFAEPFVEYDKKAPLLLAVGRLLL